MVIEIMKIEIDIKIHGVRKKKANMRAYMRSADSVFFFCYMIFKQVFEKMKEVTNFFLNLIQMALRTDCDYLRLVGFESRFFIKIHHFEGTYNYK